MIELQNVSFAYEDGGRQALKNVSLKINKGEFLAIVGHNGSGKARLPSNLTLCFCQARAACWWTVWIQRRIDIPLP